MAIFQKKKENDNIEIENPIIPVHIGIIMDGNGRWAKKRGLPRTAGHTVGAKNFRTITRYCSKIGVKYLTVYAFSTENWKRPQEEVSALMKLFKQYLQEALTDFLEDDIKIKFIGDTTAFNSELQQLIKDTEEVSKNRPGMVLNIAMNYGSRSEIVRAVKNISQKIIDKELSIDEINEQLISDYLYTGGQPDPDLIIRPSGEYRISNFLLYQSAYAEYIIDDILWPDYSTNDIDRAIKEYNNRNRRFGGV